MAVILSAIIAGIVEAGISLAADAALAETIGATVSTLTSAAEAIGVTNIAAAAEFVGASEETIEVINGVGELYEGAQTGWFKGAVDIAKASGQTVLKTASYGKAGARGVRAGIGKLRGEEDEG